MKIAIRFILASLMLMLIASTGFGWGNATHTLFSKQLGVTQGHLNDDEMYGSVVADAFNLILENKGFFMSDQCHHYALAFVANARTCGQRAAAFGLASHNDTWGADYTAHHNSFTFPGDGYASVKGDLLKPSIIVALVQILVDAGLDLTTATVIATEVAPVLGHDLSETAVDLWVKRALDERIGINIMQAAIRRSSDIGQLLADTYAARLAGALNIRLVEAKKFIMSGERDYRDQMIQYGQIFTLPEGQAIGALAVFNAAIAEGFLEAYAGVPITVDPVVVAGFIVQAMATVATDFSNELAQTLAYLGNELPARGVRSCDRSFAKGEGDNDNVANAASFSLGQNYPNPFNPSTTISFHVPSTSVVTLEIYSIIGQKVRTLMNATTLEEGKWEVVWDGRNDAGLTIPSGTYISRLATPHGVLTRKMQLVQ